MSANEAKMNTSRLLLTQLRGGDYAHAGDEEAIKIVLKSALEFSPFLKEEAVLDVGSGFGGTADYLCRALGFKNVQGFDMDEAAVVYAQKKYSSIHFKVADALKINKSYAPQSFSFFYLLNVIYAIQDKKRLLKNLSTLSKPVGILAIFDYTQKKELKTTGWKILGTIDMTSHFIRWYRAFLDKLSIQASTLSKAFSFQDVQKVEDTFTFLLNQLEQGNLGGVIIFAQKMGNEPYK
jgi:ubiquinone/menaquinone biosynthesis C-methylase UbiE